jgi:cytochrome o ubiquinol oxidase operon protein cyoD
MEPQLQQSAQGDSPGVSVQTHGSYRTYLIGLGYALVLTLTSFWAASTDLVFAPGVPVVFFLNISSAPDQTNNFLALAFGIFTVALIVFGSMIIMANLNHNMMMPME